MSDYRTFLVPYDFSEHASAALSVACELATRLGADLHLGHVLQTPPYAFGFEAYGAVAASAPPAEMARARRNALASLESVASRLGIVPGKVETHVLEGTGVADQIRALAEEIGAELIVMGTHGRTGLAHVFLGSVTERTLRAAPCPVLSVRAADPGNEG